MADNGSTDGAPEEAARPPSGSAAAAHRRQPRLRLRGEPCRRRIPGRPAASGDPEFFVVANPDVVWGPGSIDAMLEAAGRWPRAGSLGPLIRDPDGTVYPSARHQPSLIRGGMHAVVGPLWKSNPWTAAYRQDRLQPSERAVGWLSGSCLLLRRAAFREVCGFDERYFMYMEDVDLGDRLAAAGWLERVRAVGRDIARQGARDRSRSGPQLGCASCQHLHFPR